MEDRQETTDVAAREIPEGVARFSAWLRFRAERTERGTRGRPLRPGTLSILVMTSPAPDIWPSILTDYTYDSELDIADGIPP